MPKTKPGKICRHSVDDAIDDKAFISQQPKKSLLPKYSYEIIFSKLGADLEVSKNKRKKDADTAFPLL